ncbi:MAG: iron ABC transporter permease [Helicobacter sp.]|nr:iron ABC transporter permease [Helicobacter sp.]
MSNKYPPFWLSAIIFAILVPLVLPFLYVGIRSYNAGLSWGIEYILRPRVYELLSNTLILMFSVTSISILLGLASAFILERYNFAFKRFFQVSMALPLCIPAFISCFTWISLTFRVSGLFGSVMILSLAYFPLAYLPISATLRRLDMSFYEVSLSLGRSRTRTFFMVILPQLKSVIGASFLLIALHLLVEFGTVAILNFETFTTAIFQEYELSFNNAQAALLSSVLLFICIIVVLFELKIRGKDIISVAQKGVRREFPIKDLGPLAQIGAILFFSIIFILSIGVPFGMLIYWIVIGSSFALEFASFGEALFNSLGISFIGAIITICCALPLVWAVIYYRSRWLIFIERLPFLLHAIPGIVIALSLIFFTINFANPLYQTFAMVVAAYFMLYLPLAQTTLKSSLLQLNPNVAKIGSSLGKSTFSNFWSLIVPIIMPGLAAAFAIVFLSLMKELTATLILTPNDIHTLSTAVWEYTSDAQYARAAPYAMMLVIFSGVPVYLLRKYAFT